MLVLSRKIGEKVIIGDNIEVTVLRVGGNQVKLGFNAPLEMPIRREELGLPFDDDAVDAARVESDDDAAARAVLSCHYSGNPGAVHAV